MQGSHPWNGIYSGKKPPPVGRGSPTRRRLLLDAFDPDGQNFDGSLLGAVDAADVGQLLLVEEPGLTFTDTLGVGRLLEADVAGHPHYLDEAFVLAAGEAQWCSG
ncbi:hypothetical protein GCM10023075_79090 [Streptosporangium album]